MDPTKYYCAHCGSEAIKVKVIERAADYVNVMPAMPLVRRVLEIALLGRFSICFVGHEEGYGPRWAEVAGEFDLAAYFTTPCPCGNLGDPKRACSCSVARIKRHNQKAKVKRALSADLYLEVPDPLKENLPSEPFEGALKRVEQAIFKVLPLSEGAKRLLTLAVRELPLTPLREERTKIVAMAIACLEGHSAVEEAHLAEALQYQPRSDF